VEAGADKIGMVAGAATAMGIVAHAIGTKVSGRFKEKPPPKEAAKAPEEGG
jgi:hypothetical protein